MKIGILALQGAFAEHEEMLQKANADIICKEVRQKKDLEGIDGIILPGGESTVQGKLLNKLDMMAALREKIKEGLPVMATCAGLILLAENIENDSNTYLATLPVSVKRNAYGRQIASFQTENEVKGIGYFTMTFIRAPYVTKTAENVEILARVAEKIVAVRYKNQLAMSFHPELDSDYHIHKYFLQMISKRQ